MESSANELFLSQAVHFFSNQSLLEKPAVDLQHDLNFDEFHLFFFYFGPDFLSNSIYAHLIHVYHLANSYEISRLNMLVHLFERSIPPVRCDNRVILRNGLQKTEQICFAALSCWFM